jgi:hypothetical protein
MPAQGVVRMMIDGEEVWAEGEDHEQGLKAQQGAEAPCLHRCGGEDETACGDGTLMMMMMLLLLLLLLLMEMMVTTATHHEQDEWGLKEHGGVLVAEGQTADKGAKIGPDELARQGGGPREAKRHVQEGRAEQIVERKDLKKGG